MTKAALILFFITTQAATAVTLEDFKGEWKEVGFRCAGEKSFNFRDNKFASKFFTIGDGTYFHRVELTDKKSCSSVQSAGSLEVSPFADHLEVTIQASVTFECSLG